MGKEDALVCFGACIVMTWKSQVNLTTFVSLKSNYKMYSSNEKQRQVNKEFSLAKTNRTSKSINFGDQSYASTSITAAVPNVKKTSPAAQNNVVAFHHPKRWNLSAKVTEQAAIRAAMVGIKQVDVEFKHFKARPVPRSHYEPFRPVLPSEKRHLVAKEIEATKEEKDTPQSLPDDPTLLRNKSQLLFDPVNYYLSHRTWQLKPEVAEAVFEGSSITGAPTSEKETTLEVPPITEMKAAAAIPVLNAV